VPVKKQQPRLSETFSPQEIVGGIDAALALALNNVCVFARRPRTGEIQERRLRGLKEYTKAVLEPLEEHVDENLLTVEELVFVLLAAALFVQSKKTQEALPMMETARQLLGDA